MVTIRRLIPRRLTNNKGDEKGNEGDARGRGSFRLNMNWIDCGDATTTTGLPRKYLLPCS